MKNLVTVILCLFMVCSTVLADANSIAAEAKDKIAFTLTSDFYSRYIWRGQSITNAGVWQPSIGASYKGWTANIWGNVDMTSYRGAYGDQSGEFTEYDLTLDYSNKLTKKVGYSIGVIHYHFPSFSATDTTELYWGFNFDLPLSPAIKVYHGLGNENGTYANFSLSHTIENVIKFTDKINADLFMGASIGAGNGTYNKDFWGVNGTRLNDLAFTIALPVDFGNGWTVKPSLNYVTLVDGGIRDADTYSTSSDYFFSGVSISKSF